jgi:hypothetical protein
MPWTFEQRIQRACGALIDRCLLEDRQIESLKRPLFFERYAFAVGLSLNWNLWGEWFETKDQLVERLGTMDAHLVSNRSTYQFNVFSSDPGVLRKLGKGPQHYKFNHVRIVDRSCWHLKLPEPRPKGKFYGEFGWRFEFRDPQWGLDPENLQELEKLAGPTRLVTYPRTFLYLDRLNDVLMFKLIAGEQLLSLEDRHNL